MPIRRGEIYYVDLGTPRGSEQGGRRPTLIIQNDRGNRTSPTTIIAAITSRTRQAYPCHVNITVAESGLRLDSTILLEQLLTVNQSRLLNLVGTLSTAKMREVDRAIEASLGL
jgi:mRNA interferase MazF